MGEKNILIGGRRSLLSIYQINSIRTLIEKYSKYKCTLNTYSTTYEKSIDITISDIFVKESIYQLDNKLVDLTVHSLKDIPRIYLTDKKYALYIPISGDSRDSLLQINDSLKVIGTSSERRIYYIRRLYPNVTIKKIRGNLETRIQYLLNGEMDGIILSYEAVKRFNKDQYIKKIFNYKEMVPSSGQGNIAILALKNNRFSLELEKNKFINNKYNKIKYNVEIIIRNILRMDCNDLFGIYSKYIDKDTIYIYCELRGDTLLDSALKVSEISYENISRLITS